MDKQAIVDAKQLKNALTQVAVLTEQNFSYVQLRFSEKILEIFTHNQEKEAAENQLPIKYQGEALEISFNLKYLVDVLNVLDSPEIKISLASRQTNIIIAPVKSTHKSLFFIMPVTL